MQDTFWFSMQDTKCVATRAIFQADCAVHRPSRSDRSINSQRKEILPPGTNQSNRWTDTRFEGYLAGQISTLDWSIWSDREGWWSHPHLPPLALERKQTLSLGEFSRGS